MSQVFVNGIRQSWASIRIGMLGRTLEGVTKIMYENPTAKENLYGKGNKPIARGRGNQTPTASITLYGFEIVALQKAAAQLGFADISEIDPFDITVTYLAEGSDEPTVDIIRNAEFTTNGREVNQGDTSITRELSLIISHIAWGGVEPKN